MAQYSRVRGSVALLRLTNPPVNALSAAVSRDLERAVRSACADSAVRVLVLRGHGGTFCGGADIRELAGLVDVPFRVGVSSLVALVDAVEAAEKPVVAAIEGVALGGGLELALGCHFRIAHGQARLGLPEVTLGLLPAAGGTQRLPRLVGFPAALELVATGRDVSAEEALALGLVDHVTDGDVEEAAVEFARRVADEPLASRRLSTRPPPRPADLDTLLQVALERAQRRARGALAPVACVQAARAMQYCFFAQRIVGKWSLPGGANWRNSPARAVSRAAVIGLGTMGRGIAVSLVRAGIPVVAMETDEKQLRVVTAMLEREAAKQRRSPDSYLQLVQFTLERRDLGDADLVVEAVFEDLALKKRLFAELSSSCRPDTLLCSNTSALDVDALAAATRRPELVVGMHFFAPAHVMKLLEVVCGARSSPVAVATAMQLGKRLGKVSVAVANCPGFAGNRMLKPYVEQASFLLEEGATPQQVDAVLEDFGFAMGVFRMSDLSGLDVGWRVREEAGLAGPTVPPGESARRRHGCRYSPLADLLCEHGRLGQKTGRGWYLYEGPGGRAATPDPWLHDFLDQYRRRHGLRPRRIDQQEVLERCLYALANEGFRILEEGVAAGPEDIDTIYVLGYGWPAHRGGPMYHVAAVGLPAVLSRLEHFRRLHPDVPQLRPSALLRHLVAEGSPPISRWRELLKGLRSQL
ncbi:peroxisomal bifunctional enzyme isoform X2 [Scleropages formosus]|uniref:peroxisomal bifunctional enzyme isoform X2 n=1 Tax=Scleropages formosus TaxID=113540 RepID=UPI0010FA8E7C|nr:peroxisomal bifunctional enzyme isoform X2 [Scleropages formosus]